MKFIADADDSHTPIDGRTQQLCHSFGVTDMALFGNRV